MEHVTIRMLKTADEIAPIFELEKTVWQTDTPMPSDQMITAAKHGGIVLGAFLDEAMIGFQYSFAGFDGKEAYLCSHMLGTHPDYRHMKVGEKLKWAQREAALALGYRFITWTYDPLETANAYLNIHKLGAVCSTYIENCYGDMEDSLNRGIASDRFEVRWHIESKRVAHRANGAFGQTENIPRQTLLDWSIGANGAPVPATTGLDMTRIEASDTVYLPVPAHFQQMKKQNKPLAIEWRQVTREVFTCLFAHGFVVTDLIRNDPSAPVHVYVITKGKERIA
ncbi:GNAT family N-acetyltransferase [Aneurinibacillus sp. BA2021]|nr:GNAT family N-acetyltransferase [Aneurinibacillus sp. BA2021]